jgi:RimJ/RimL family protein N-acetyltransferase
MEKIIIKPLRHSDIDNIMTWVNNPEVVKNFQHFSKKFSRKDEAVHIKRMLASKNDFVFSFFSAEGGSASGGEKKNDIYIGQGGIHQISWENKLGRLSLFIKPEFQGHGFGQTALRLLLAQGFKNLKLHKLWLIIWASNKRGIHIYKKLGFKQE